MSDVHGTTRDFIEDTTIINGIQFRFVDTAGIRPTDDVVENIGIERTYQKLQEAKIVLWLIDQQPTEAEIEDIKERVADKKLIIVRNKIDLPNSSLKTPHRRSRQFLLRQASLRAERKIQNSKFKTHS